MASLHRVRGRRGSRQVQPGRRLAETLRQQGRQVVVTHEPGDSRIGPGIRQMLLDTGNRGLSPKAEALLYAADRAEHVDALIRPALAEGKVVISDRYVDSSLAYQGAGRELAEQDVEHINAWATAGLLPDLTVLLDIDPELGLRRAGATPDRLESRAAGLPPTRPRQVLRARRATPGRLPRARRRPVQGRARGRHRGAGPAVALVTVWSDLVGQHRIIEDLQATARAAREVVDGSGPGRGHDARLDLHRPARLGAEHGGAVVRGGPAVHRPQPGRRVRCLPRLPHHARRGAP